MLLSREKHGKQGTPPGLETRVDFRKQKAGGYCVSFLQERTAPATAGKAKAFYGRRMPQSCDNPESSI
jgi:hypothetical protein